MVSGVDLAAAAAAAADAGAVGAVWRLTDSPDLQANLVRLPAGERVAEHVEAGADVLVLVVAGAGTLTVGDRAAAAAPLVLTRLPAGAARSIAADRGEDLVYLTVHRRKGGLGIGRSATMG